MIAAVCAGLLSFTFILLFNEMSGYDRLGREGLRRFMTSLFGYSVFGHLATGSALAAFTRWLCRMEPPRAFVRPFLFFSPVLFLIAFYSRQLFVRNGWLAKGSEAVAFFGTPDFETIAVASAFCLSIFLFLLVVRNGYPSNAQARLVRATFITLCCGTVFFAISAAHNILVTGGWLDVEGHFIAPTVLKYRFPHPERLPLICFMIFIQMFFTLKFVGERFVRPALTEQALP